MNIEAWWAKQVAAFCKWYTKGAHDMRDRGTYFKCRICGYKIEKPSPPQPEPEPQPEPDPQPNPDPSGEPNPATPSAYRAGFLWKPISESDGKLIVLAPAAFTGKIHRTYLHDRAGWTEDGVGVGVYNGGRWHTRFRKVGGAYPVGVEFCLRTDAGRVWAWKVSAPSQRNDGNITPTVEIP